VGRAARANEANEQRVSRSRRTVRAAGKRRAPAGARAPRQPRERTAALVVVGDEILSGRTIDTNSLYLARTLRELGVRLLVTITVPDKPRLIQEAVGFCRHRVSYVFTSGGLGPTHDDVTLKGVSRALGVPLVRNPELERRLRALFGESLNEDQLKMAQVPRGAKLHYYPNLRLPIVSIRNIFLFPGIPELFQQKVDAMRETLRSAPYFTREILSTRRESDIARLLRTAIARYPKTRIGSYPRWKGKKYKVTIVVESKDRASVQQASTFLQEGLRRIQG